MHGQQNVKKKNLWW